MKVRQELFPPISQMYIKEIRNRFYAIVSSSSCETVADFNHWMKIRRSVFFNR